MKNYSILINTCDNFEVCWIPFFKLFKKFWPNYKGKIYLNTELKEYQHSGLNIISIKNEKLGKKWSQCLKYALEFIDEEYILYMQEDYFLLILLSFSLFQIFRSIDVSFFVSPSRSLKNSLSVIFKI